MLKTPLYLLGRFSFKNLTILIDFIKYINLKVVLDILITSTVTQNQINSKT